MGEPSKNFTPTTEGWKFGFHSFSEKVENFTQACVFLLLYSNMDFCVRIKPQRENTEKEGEEEDGRVEVQQAGQQIWALVLLCLPGRIAGPLNLPTHVIDSSIGPS